MRVAAHDPYASMSEPSVGAIDVIAMPVAGGGRSDAIDAISDWPYSIAGEAAA